ncbi:MAG: hypothetical protein C0483_13490 [Pirellula sp.]|nr:hypothetical protein [Pirellula sp.]
MPKTHSSVDSARAPYQTSAFAARAEGDGTVVRKATASRESRAQPVNCLRRASPVAQDGAFLDEGNMVCKLTNLPASRFGLRREAMHRFIAVCVMLASGALRIGALASPTDDVYQGRVSAVSKSSVAIVDKQGENVTFLIGAECKITRDGKPSEAMMLGTGDRVQITAKEDAGKLVAVAISAFSAERVVVSRSYSRAH